MKTNKWVRWIITTLLTVIVLAGVGFAGFRVGVAQAANLTADGAMLMFQHSRGGDGSMMDGNSNMRSSGHGHSFKGQTSEQGHDFSGRNSSRGRDGFSFFSPLFGLLRLAVLGGLVWLGYTLVKRSGWRVVNVNASQAASAEPEPVEAVEADVEAEEKKDEA